MQFLTRVLVRTNSLLLALYTTSMIRVLRVTPAIRQNGILYLYIHYTVSRDWENKNVCWCVLGSQGNYDKWSQEWWITKTVKHSSTNIIYHHAALSPQQSKLPFWYTFAGFSLSARFFWGHLLAHSLAEKERTALGFISWSEATVAVRDHATWGNKSSGPIPTLGYGHKSVSRSPTQPPSFIC